MYITYRGPAPSPAAPQATNELRPADAENLAEELAAASESSMLDLPHPLMAHFKDLPNDALDELPIEGVEGVDDDNLPIDALMDELPIEGVEGVDDDILPIEGVDELPIEGVEGVDDDILPNDALDELPIEGL